MRFEKNKIRFSEKIEQFLSCLVLSLENCKNLEKLHRVSCGNVTEFFSTNPVLGNIAVSLNFAVVMHPNGPKCHRNE